MSAFGVTERGPHDLQILLDNEGVNATGELEGSVIYRFKGDKSKS